MNNTYHLPSRPLCKQTVMQLHNAFCLHNAKDIQTKVLGVNFQTVMQADAVFHLHNAKRFIFQYLRPSCSYATPIGGYAYLHNAPHMGFAA